MENLEILKGIVSDETYATLEAETKDSAVKLADLSKGEYVLAGKVTGLESQLEKVNAALTKKTEEYDALESKAGDNQSLKDEIERMKTAHTTELENLKTEYQAQAKRNRVVAEISSKYHPKDVNDIMPHVDLSKITIDGEKTIGLTEQLDPLKESKSYLFDDNSGTQHKKGGFEHGDGGTDEDAALKAAFGINTKKE